MRTSSSMLVLLRRATVVRASRSWALAATMIVAALGATSCERKCQNPDHCVRTCQCRDAARDRTISCPVSFACDVEREVCEDALTAMTCDEICQQFATPINAAGENLCGRRKCQADVDCARSVLCQTAPGPNGEPGQQFDCDAAFLCDVQLGFCEPAASASDTQICIERCAGG